MAFRISLNKATKAQIGSKSKQDEDAKAKEEKNALDALMADVLDEHGEDGGVFGAVEQVERKQEVFVPTGAKRHFTGRPKSMKSGPGTLGAESGAAFGPSIGSGGYGKSAQSGFGGPGMRGLAAFEGAREENVYTTVVAKASNLPPAMEARQVEDIFQEFPSLKVTKVEKLPPSRPSSPTRARPSATMKVTFDKEASARDLDDAMNKLNDRKYLGKGYYLHLDRYLGGRSSTTRQQEEAFGATLQDVELPRGFAPPPDLGGISRERAREEAMNKRLLITANAPPDLATMKLIHQTVEGVVQGGLEFEAALMEDPHVQDQERFAWLFNQKHPLNRYYRWRLREVVSASIGPEVFEHQPDWKGPKEHLVDEYAAEPAELNHPSDGSESDEEDEKAAWITVPTSDIYPGRVATGFGILTPRSRAILIWLLSTLPPSAALYDEIAAFSHFAVEHATKGLDEVVYLLITNVFQPFFFSKSNPKERPPSADGKDDDGANANTNPEDDTRKRAQLPQLAINALRVISDVALTTNKEPGSCYKYRSVIGAQLTDRKVFEYLELLPAQLSLGRMGETAYREEVNGILRAWHEEHLFDKEMLARFDAAFNGRRREREREELEKRVLERRRGKKGAVPVLAQAATSVEKEGEGEEMDVDQPDAELKGSNLHKPASAPANDASQVGKDAVSQDRDAPKEEDEGSLDETAAARARRLRPKAEDMFASDDE